MKRLIILVAALLIFLMLLSLLLPKNVSVAKSVTIHAPQQAIMEQVNEFKNWPLWFPLLKENLATIEMQTGNHAVLKRENGKNIDVQFIFKGRDSVLFTTSIASGAAQTYLLKTQPLSDGGVRADMIVSTSFKWYPWQRARSLFMDKLTGPQYEEALKNLQVLCEQE